jgi:hypothetical protein
MNKIVLRGRQITFRVEQFGFSVINLVLSNDSVSR